MAFTWTWSPTSWPEIISFLTKLQQAYVWTNLATDSHFMELVNLDLTDPQDVWKMWWNILKNVLREEIDLEVLQESVSENIIACAINPWYTNATFSELWSSWSWATVPTQAWQNTDIANPCYYECALWYSWNDCSVSAYSCATNPWYTNATYVEWTPSETNQAWQNTNSSNPCYYECDLWYLWVDCSISTLTLDANSIVYITGEEAVTSWTLGVSGWTFTDSKSNVLTWNGNATQSSTQSKIGWKSLYLDWTDDYFLFNDNSLLNNMTTGTMEAWIYLEEYPSLPLSTVYESPVFSKWAVYLTFWVNSNQKLNWYYYSGVPINWESSSVINLNKWHHVAWTWNSTSQKLFIDWVEKYSWTNEGPGYNIHANHSVWNQTLIIWWTQDLGATEYFKWYLDNLHISNIGYYQPRNHKKNHFKFEVIFFVV